MAAKCAAVLVRLAVLVLTLQFAARAMAAEPGIRPNIILCMTDDQGWGDVSYNGLKRIKTPVLDTMAASGLRFDRFYAHQSCSPTRASVLTGRHPNRIGVFWPGMPMRRQEITLAQAAKMAGYVTAHFGKWHLNGVAGPGKPITAVDPLGPGFFGFDEWLSVSNYFELDWTFSRKGEDVKTRGDGSDVIVAESLKFIEQAAGRKQPFLVLVWFGSPHAPHKAMPEDLKAAGGSGYYGQMLAVDRSMGTLRAGLRRLGIADNTVVWFCSDNGGWLNPKAPDAEGTNAGLRGRKGDMWEGGIRVPAVMEWPARIRQPVITAIPAGVVDIYPTIVDIIGAKVPHQVEPLDGISLVPLIDGQMKQRPKPMGFWQGYGGSMVGPAAWNDNQYKLNKVSDKRWELYDIVADPAEETDIAEKHPEVVNRMKAELQAWQQSVLRSYRGEDYRDPSANVDPPPLRGLEEVGHAQVQLRGGFWGPRLKACQEVTIPHALDCLEKDGHVTNFDKAAGKFDGPLRGHHAFDSDLHKALEGALYSLQHNKDDALRQRVEGIISRILAAQQKDGFLISCWIVEGLDRRWEDLRLQHQMYNAGHFFEMAVEHARMSGQSKVLDAAKRFADHIDSVFGPGKRYDVDGHQEIELALVKLFRATGDRRYLELSRFFLDERGYAHGTERRPFDPKTVVEPPKPADPQTPEQRRAYFQARLRVRNGRMQDHKPVVEQLDAVGHAVRAGYMYSAMADIVRFMDDSDYERALDSLWNGVVSRKMYLTGGIGTGQYDDEGFGDPYLLPNRSAYCESCAAIAHVLWQHRMSLLKGQAKYADVMELALYNGVLSGISINGNSFFYQNPLASQGGRRSNWIGLSCCPTNLTRMIPQVGGLVYARGRGQLYVNLYAAGEASIRMVDGTTVKLSQQTDYPWDGRVRLTISPDQPGEFALCLRIPGWALGRPVPSDLYRFAKGEILPVRLKVNGATVDATPRQDGYVRVRRQWKAGDVVELELPMTPQRVYAHANVKDDQGKVALMRGPIVYCVEAADHANVDVSRLVLPRESPLRTEHRPALLGGVTILEGNAMTDGARPVPLMAVPYYAWANRERGGMTVWINEAQ